MNIVSQKKYPMASACVKSQTCTSRMLFFFRITSLKTLDLSDNKIKHLGAQLAVLKELKSLNVDRNEIVAGGLEPVASLTKLQSLSAGGNKLGAPTTTTALPSKLPSSLKHIKLDGNAFSSFPLQIVSTHMTKLEKIDLSNNHLAAIPSEISFLQALTELNLDHNVIVALPASIGQLSKLKTLSLKSNQIRATSATYDDEKNPQPLPASLFSSTLLIDLNLHGNPMTSTQLNEFQGYADFLARREKVKSKDIYGGALVNLDVCGLK